MTQRQLGVVDAQGRGATFTGKECLDWAGGRTGRLRGAGEHPRLRRRRWTRSPRRSRRRRRPLAERLLDCLDAAQAAGGDRRGQQSAALLVVEQDGGYAGLSDNVVELRVDDHERPLEELRRLYGLHQALFGETPREEWLDVDDELAAELRDRLARLGYDGELDDAFNRWAGNENLEERVDGTERIDPSCWRSCGRRRERGLRGRSLDELEGLPDRRRRARLAAGPAPVRDHARSA